MVAAECGVSVHQSIVLIGVGKQQQQRQPCLRGAGLHICQVFCIYGPPENSLSSSVDQASVLLVMPTFSKLSSVSESGRAFLQGGLPVAPTSQVWSLGSSTKKIRIQSFLCGAHRMPWAKSSGEESSDHFICKMADFCWCFGSVASPIYLLRELVDELGWDSTINLLTNIYLKLKVLILHCKNSLIEEMLLK